MLLVFARMLLYRLRYTLFREAGLELTGRAAPDVTSRPNPPRRRGVKCDLKYR